MQPGGVVFANDDAGIFFRCGARKIFKIADQVRLVVIAVLKRQLCELVLRFPAQIIKKVLKTDDAAELIRCDPKRGLECFFYVSAAVKEFFGELVDTDIAVQGQDPPDTIGSQNGEEIIAEFLVAVKIHENGDPALETVGERDLFGQGGILTVDAVSEWKFLT